jgi:hypothetical protein
MSRLDRDQAAESPPEDKDRRNAKKAAGRIENKSQPTNAFAAEGQEIDAVRISREITIDDPEHAQSGDDSTIGAILPDAGADMRLGEQRCEPERDRDAGHRDQRRIREESPRAAGPGDRQP